MSTTPISRAAVSNPLGQLTAGQQQAIMAQLQADRERTMRTRASLLIIVVGISLLAVAGGLAFGWPGILAGLGLPTFVLGLMLGLFTPSSS